MRFKCLATGSTGNCYVLENQAGQALLLDCGIRWKDIKRLLAYRIELFGRRDYQVRHRGLEAL